MTHSVPTRRSADLWNFPLAIFIGQVAAALATGNSVLAKPAEQTTLVGFEAVKLLHEAGVPVAVLQLVPGDGVTVGAALTGDPRIAGVVRSEEHTSELQSLMRISYAGFCLKK